MTSIQEIRKVRLEKKSKLIELNIDPYPSEVLRTHAISDLDANFTEGEEVSIVGRVMSLRGQGALAFIDLFDGTGRFQALLKQDEDPKYDGRDDLVGFDLFKETVDEGDFVKVTGKLFVTQRGQNTVAVESWSMVAKSLRPLPDEFYGLKDEDERYRQRYVDILLNEETRKIVERKSIFWNTFRSFLLKKDFIEVQTPVLESTPGGAEATPFTTHHNALDIDVYLRISCGELWQKKLMVAGMPRVFEIGRIFRNEGMSNEHLQDYTQIEFYQAFSNYTEGMEMITNLYREVAEKTFGTLEFEINGAKINLGDDWKKYDYVEIIKEKFDIDVLDTTLDEVVNTLKSEKIDFDSKNINLERGVDLLWKKCRKELNDPGFLINVPVYLEPLAKKNKEDNRVVDRFQVIFGGSELGKGFSELNDPIDQLERFEHQESLRESGDDEAQMKDDEYVQAMEYGMPPTFGFGISERLFSVLNGTSIRETTIFPLMKPKED